MGPINSMPIMPYPAFDVARYAVMAAKISKEQQVSAEPFAEAPDSAEDVAEPSTAPTNAAAAEMLSTISYDDQLTALGAAEDLVKLSQGLNESLQTTLDEYF